MFSFYIGPAKMKQLNCVLFLTEHVGLLALMRNNCWQIGELLSRFSSRMIGAASNSAQVDHGLMKR